MLPLFSFLLHSLAISICRTLSRYFSLNSTAATDWRAKRQRSQEGGASKVEEGNSDFVMLIITMNTVRLFEQARTASNRLHKLGGNGKAILVAVMVPPIIVTPNCRHRVSRELPRYALRFMRNLGRSELHKPLNFLQEIFPSNYSRQKVIRNFQQLRTTKNDRTSMFVVGVTFPQPFFFFFSLSCLFATSRQCSTLPTH